jgi:hypothetical protein
MSKTLEIFRAGSHTAMSGQTLEFTEEALRATAAAYDPSIHEAPLVVGHPKHDAPAFGWIDAVIANGQSLAAEPVQVEPTFKEWVDQGRYKKISASFYDPKSPQNPVPGVYYLRHVGFLGAMPPAIKGMKPIELAEGEEGIITIEFGENTSFSKGEQMKEELDRREAELTEREAKLRAKERRLEFSEALDGLVKEGRILAVEKSNHLRQLQLLDAIPKESLINFSEGNDNYDPVDEYLDGLKKTPKRVEFSEITGEDPVEPSTDPVTIACGIQSLVDDAKAKGRSLSFAEASHQFKKNGGAS